jgi:hypothetical protein
MNHSGTAEYLQMKAIDRPHAWSWWYLLLLAECAVVLWVSFYNSLEPSWIGIPFFYWSQMALVIASAAVNALVYVATERSNRCR